MPVQFKSKMQSLSEYTKQFGSAWAYFRPDSNIAGKESSKYALTIEPPLQHKKRIGGPQTSLSTNFFSVPSKENDFALLGQQEKFSQNVRYKPKPTLSTNKIYKNKENFDDAPPPSKQLKMVKKPKLSTSEGEPIAPRVLSPPPAPREPKEGLKDKDLKDILEDATNSNDKAKSVSSNMNESVQTNMKKGITDSAPEAPAEYALKYKAGVAPPRPIKKFSEYQRQFQWTNGIKASPLLAADEVVYQSHADLGPYKTEGIPKKSEYQLQFKKWKLPDTPVDYYITVDAPKPKKKSGMKKSKSTGAIEKICVEDKGDDIAPVEAPSTEEAPSSEDQLKEKLMKSHGKLNRLGSEYKTNFRAPHKYEVVKGAWHGADPPQLIPQPEPVESPASQQKADENNNDNKVPEEPLSNWFAEVLELRRRANEYRKRAQGTHFSREHLVQLMAKQTACWDADSPRSSTLSALNLETLAAGIISSFEKPEAVEADPEVSEVEKTAEDKNDNKLIPTEPKKGKSRENRQSRKMAWLEEQKEQVAQQQKRIEEIEKMESCADDDVSEAVSDVEEEGRLPTPKLKATGQKPRHHFDLTTPSIGGALLTCPPAKSAHLIVTNRSGDSYVTMNDEIPAKKYDLDTLVTVPAGGKLTVDTHALRDDEAESDRGLVTKYIASPPLESEDKENKGQRKRKSKKPSNLSTVHEGLGKTYLNLADIQASTGVNKQDDDVMSVSLQSVASSGSLASEVLERARKRQQFWSKKD